MEEVVRRSHGNSDVAPLDVDSSPQTFLPHRDDVLGLLLGLR